jgi:hypothetical protein
MCVLPVLQKLLTGAARALFTDGSPLTFSPPPPPLSLPPPFHSPLSLSLPPPPLPPSPPLPLSLPLSSSLSLSLLPSTSLYFPPLRSLSEGGERRQQPTNSRERHWSTLHRKTFTGPPSLRHRRARAWPKSLSILLVACPSPPTNSSM